MRGSETCRSPQIISQSIGNFFAKTFHENFRWTPVTSMIFSYITRCRPPRTSTPTEEPGSTARDFPPSPDTAIGSTAAVASPSDVPSVAPDLCGRCFLRRFPNQQWARSWICSPVTAQRKASRTHAPQQIHTHERDSLDTNPRHLRTHLERAVKQPHITGCNP